MMLQISCFSVGLLLVPPYLCCLLRFHRILPYQDFHMRYCFLSKGFYSKLPITLRWWFWCLPYLLFQYLSVSLLYKQCSVVRLYNFYIWYIFSPTLTLGLPDNLFSSIWKSCIFFFCFLRFILEIFNICFILQIWSPFFLLTFVLTPLIIINIWTNIIWAIKNEP